MLARSTTCDARNPVKKLWFAACLYVFASWPAAAMDLELAGKQALVTGSTSGIGYAIAAALLREGADVIVNGRSQATVDAAIASLREATGKRAEGFRRRHVDGRRHERNSRRVPERRHPRQQRRRLRAASVRAKHRRRLVSAHRLERHERRAAVAAVPAADARGELGPHHLHLERERVSHSAGQHSLRHDEGRADRGRARPRRSDGDDGHHRQQRGAGPDAHAVRRQLSARSKPRRVAIPQSRSGSSSMRSGRRR